MTTIYHITETKLEQTMACYHRTLTNTIIIQHRMMRAQMIIKETENTKEKVPHTPPLK